MDIFVLLSLPSFYVAQWFLRLYYYLYYDREEAKTVPKVTDPLLNQSATSLSEKIRKQEVSSEELVKVYIKRIKEVNPIVNAVIEDRFDLALEDARNVDNTLKNLTDTNELHSEKPLLGIPVTIKECFAVKGLSFTGCSKTREGIKAKEDSDVVKLLKNAGAIPLLVSSMPEYCASIETENMLIGRTRNPYNTRYTSGGSSGGEGALLGAGASLLGIGSDICGSIRIPCAFNGIFGHKPTGGVVSLEGCFPLCSDKKSQKHVVVGPMTRYVEDLKLAYKVLCAQEYKELKLDDKVELSEVKVYYMDDLWFNLGFSKVDEEVKNAVETAVVYLNEQFNCSVRHRKFEEMDSAYEAASLVVFRMENPPNSLMDSKVKYCLVKEFLKIPFGKSTFTLQYLIFNLMHRINTVMPEIIIQKYADKTEKIKEMLLKELGDDGILIYPNFPTGAFAHGEFLSNLPGTRFLGIFNVLGFPVTCIPVGLNGKGLPIGIQVIAAPYQDRLCLAAAEELTKYFGGWQAPS